MIQMRRPPIILPNTNTRLFDGAQGGRRLFAHLLSLNSMSTWRRKAIELFPDLRDAFQAADTTIYDVFLDLLPRCREAHENEDNEELQKIYGYVAWCAHQNNKDLWNAAGVGFYEHIIDCRQAVDQFHRWVEPDIFEDISELLEWAMGQTRFQKLKDGYETKTENMQKRDLTMMEEAREFAVRRHGDQKYGDHPYSVHLDAVARISKDYGDTAGTIAYLHDVVEDTDVTVSEIELKFGKLVADCVAILTDEPGKNRKERKSKTYAKMAAVSGETQIALIVKAADRLANMRSCVAANHQRLLSVYKKEHSVFRR